MNAAKMSLMSTILAAALGLALGLAAAPAMADQPIEGVHGHGGDNGDELATPLDVIVDKLSVLVDGMVFDSVENCTGTAVSSSPLAVDIDQGCTINVPSIMKLGDDEGQLSLFRVDVRTRKNRGTDIMLCFSTGEAPSAVNDVSVYCADRLNATVCIESLGPDPRIYLTPSMSPDGVKLRKLHQPFKGEFTEEKVRVGEFCYTAQGEGFRCIRNPDRPNGPSE